VALLVKVTTHLFRVLRYFSGEQGIEIKDLTNWKER